MWKVFVFTVTTIAAAPPAMRVSAFRSDGICSMGICQ